MVVPCLFCGGDRAEAGHGGRCDGRQGLVEACYPESAGWKATDTSHEAAVTTDAATVRHLVVRWLRTHGPHTADETAAGLGLSLLTVRPRLSELRALDLVDDSGDRRLNVSGKRAIVWRVTDAQLRGVPAGNPTGGEPEKPAREGSPAEEGPSL